MFNKNPIDQIHYISHVIETINLISRHLYCEVDKNQIVHFKIEHVRQYINLSHFFNIVLF